MIDLTNRGSRCLYHVRLFRDLYIAKPPRQNTERPGVLWLFTPLASALGCLSLVRRPFRI
nr:MAG TPA: hypothetical protein [Caudoviricetes sp.]